MITTPIEDLITCARLAVEDGGESVRYMNEDDEIGDRVCCGVISYNKHAPLCWVSRLREALKPFDEQLEKLA